MSVHPRISVVLPFHNAAPTIERAIQSILDDGFEDLELIAVDDGSKDDGPTIVDRIGDPRIRLLRQPHTGVVEAANRAVSEARAKFIARMDADDYSHPDRLAAQLAVLESGEADAVGGRVRIVNAAGAPVPSLQRYQSWINDHLDSESVHALRFVESPIVNPTALARREVFDPGFREGNFPEDYDLWLSAIERGYRLVKIPRLVLDWTDGPGRLTRTHPRYSRAAFDRCRRRHLLNGPLKDRTEVILWGAGNTGKPWLQWLQQQDISVRCIIEVSPRKIGERIHQVPVIGPECLPQADGTPIVIAVGAEGARELIEPAIRQRGYRPGKDSWFVA